MIEALDGGEAAVGERFVDEPPKMIGWLEFGTVGGLEYETNAVGGARLSCRTNASRSVLLEQRYDHRRDRKALVRAHAHEPANPRRRE